MYLPEVHAVNEGLGAVAGPHALVGELAHVPHELVHDLRKLDGVGGRAGTAVGDAGTLAVSDVALMVGAVKVLSVPACGEDDGLADHLALGVRGDIDSVAARARSSANEWSVAGRCPAPVADAVGPDLASICV